MGALSDVVSTLGEEASQLIQKIRSVPECTLPRLESPLVFDPVAQWDRRGDLLQFGIELMGTPGPGSRVIVAAAAPRGRGRLRIELFGCSDQLVLVDSGHNAMAYVRLETADQTLVIGKGGVEPFHAHSIILRGRNTLAMIGAGATSNGAKLLVDGEGTGLTIGDDCMLAHDIEIIATDSHGIFDIETLEQINPPKSVRLGKHVWIGSQTSILKGVTIGNGSIIGTKSLVTRDIPPFCLYAGAPARPLRSGVSWSRHLVPSDDGKRAVLRDLGKL